MHRLSGQEELSVGASYEGEARSLPGGERLFANTTNVLPLRSRAGEETRRSRNCFAATKDRVLEANEHQNYFFGRLIKKLGLRARSEPPAGVLRVLQLRERQVRSASSADGLRVELMTEDVPYRSPRDTAMFELVPQRRRKGWRAATANATTARDLFDGETVARWLGHYRTLLDGDRAATPMASIWTLPLLDAAERQPMLVEWNATDGGLSAGECHAARLDRRAGATHAGRGRRWSSRARR